MTVDGLILVVGSGVQRYREYLLSSAARRPLWLLDAAPPTWQLRHITGYSVVEQLDAARPRPDGPALLAAARQVATENDVAGVLSYDDPLVVATAHIAEDLGLPGLTVTGAENCRDKARTRRLLTEAGLPQPRYACVTDLRQACREAAEIGYPVVLKPRAMGASLGVVRVLDAAMLAAAFTTAAESGQRGNPDYADGVLVEEMLTGPEISIDGAVQDGRYQPLFVARKSLGFEPYFEETGHLVSSDDPLLTDPRLRDTLDRAHRALGVQDGLTHTEIKLADQGPAIVEVNARLGGDLIPYIARLAGAADPATVAVDVATGRPVRPGTTRQATVGIRFCYPPADGQIAQVSLPRPGEVPGLVEAEQIVPDGAELRLPPRGYANLCRFALLICEAADPEACADRLAAAQAQVKIRLVGD
jgi:biotin carboxylase